MTKEDKNDCVVLGVELSHRTYIAYSKYIMNIPNERKEDENKKKIGRRSFIVCRLFRVNREYFVHETIFRMYLSIYQVKQTKKKLSNFHMCKYTAHTITRIENSK